MDFRRLKAWTALLAVISAVLLAVALIISIWSDFQSEILWKTTGTFFVLFFLSALIHAIMQGMTQKANEKE